MSCKSGKCDDDEVEKPEITEEMEDSFGIKYKKWEAPTKCARCEKPLAECENVSGEREMDGLHFWSGIPGKVEQGFFCEACLLQYGKEEAERA